MRLRLEVGKSRSSSWPLFLRAAAKGGFYRRSIVDGQEVHIVCFNSIKAFTPVFQICCSWAAVAVYCNGNAITRDEAWEIYWRSRGLSRFGTPIDLADDPNGDAPKTASMLRHIIRDGGAPEPGTCPRCGQLLDD
jgi:hypothetical protein